MKRIAFWILAVSVLAIKLGTVVAHATLPDVENRFVQIVQQQTGTTADRPTILAVAYEDICGPVRRFVDFDVANRLGISLYPGASQVGAIAIYTGICYT